MYWHWQNLNDKSGGRQGSGFIAGRAWFYPLHRRNTDGPMGPCFRVEWHWFNPSCRLALNVDPHNDESICLTFAIPFVISLYFGFESFRWLDALARWLRPRLADDCRWYEGRELSFAIHSAALWWRVWSSPDSWSSSTPRWRDGSFHLWDFLVGRTRYGSKVLSTTEVVISMPERSYPARVELKLAWHQRARWFTRYFTTAEVTVLEEGGLPIPGKGENSWDCGEDAIFSLSCPASTVEGAIAALTESALNSRRRHGGSIHWTPRPPSDHAA